MAEKDMAAKAFFGRPDIVADLCNCIFFKGKKLVRAEDVRDLSTELTVGAPDKGNHGKAPDSLRICDALKRITYLFRRRRESFDLGIEYQSTGSRNYLFRPLDYLGRLFTRIIIAWRKRLEPLILPIIMVTLNLTCRPWTYPCSLNLRFKGVDRRLRKFMKFTINVIDPFTLDEKIINMMCPELKTVINCFRFSRDREMLFRILESVPGGTLSREAVHLLNTFLDLGLKIPEKEEKVVVCKAVKEMKLFLVHEGEKKGMQKGM